jgi:predicted dehydrogenase
MNDEKKENNKLQRRDFLTGLATIPVLGLFGAGLLNQILYNKNRDELLKSDFNLGDLISESDEYQNDTEGDLLRIGIIGTGSRGMNLLESLGFTNTRTKNKLYGNLKIQLAGVCDVYDDAAEEAIMLSKYNSFVKNSDEFPRAKRYKNYLDMLSDKEIDAVIIATPDHWHAKMIIESANAGKHIFAEKCLTRTIEEVYQIKDALKNKKIVFQYGHQNRQQLSYKVARQMIMQNILGKITLLKTHTYRNTPQGAFIRHLDQKIDPDKVDWQQWLGDTPYYPFTPSRYFGWQKFFEYSGGLPAHMFSHEYDAINQVFKLGIPKSVVAMGGIYYWKDDRNTPDVFQASFEYPDRELILTYDANLANTSTGEYERGAKVKEIVGNDAWMKLGLNITIYPDKNSEKYKEKIKQGLVEPDSPLLSFIPGENKSSVQTITSASKKLYASSGLVSTYRNGKEVDVTYLHLREWLEGIRKGIVVSGTFQTAFEDAITCHMATKSYLEKRRVEWDPVNQKVI